MNGLLYIAAALVLCFSTGSSEAHIGDKLYLIYQIPEEKTPDLHDGSIDDWSGLLPATPLNESDFTLDTTTGDATAIDASDLSYTIYMGWSSAQDKLYMAIDRLDNTYINDYEGGAPANLWRYDGIEFMVDGDHSGGEYATGGPNSDSEAQQYLAVPTSPDGQTLGLSFHGADSWVIQPPYGDAGGAVLGGTPHRSLIELGVTPFDLIGGTPAESRISPLHKDKIIGFNISVPDFDEVSGTYHAFHSLSGQAATWRYAERFVDGRLIGCDGCGIVKSATRAGGRDWDEPALIYRYSAKEAAAVMVESWARIKASLEGDE